MSMAFRAAIKSLKEHIEEEQARFDGWKQTHERKDGQWVALQKQKEKA